MLVIDAHLDLAWNALQWGRDLHRSVFTIRTLENRSAGAGRGCGTVAFPELRSGRVALSIVTVLARSTGRPVPDLDYASIEQAYAVGRGQLSYYHALEAAGTCRVVGDCARLDAHIDEWERWDRDAETSGRAAPPLGFTISMEGADPIVDPQQLEEWHRGGLRLLGLAHYGPGRYAGGTGTEVGLTSMGRQLLGEMERLGVLLDLTHSSDETFWESLDVYSGPVLASHNNCRALVPHQRQFSDEQIRAVIERDGVIGAAFDCWMLSRDWTIGESDPATVTLSDVVRHIEHICEIAGNTRHVAIGTDLDGGFGKEQSPSDLETIADLQNLAPLLESRGFSADDIAAILHGNWLRFLRQSWSANG